MKIRNTFIIFIVSGFWHGANWTFIAWGALNALFFLPLLLTKSNRRNLDIVAEGKFFPSLREFSSILGTFGLTVLAWIFFRANSIGHALQILRDIFSSSLWTIPQFPSMAYGYITFGFVALLLCVEWMGRDKEFGISGLGLEWRRPYRWSLYFALIILMFVFRGQEQQFLYFQF